MHKPVLKSLAFASLAYASLLSHNTTNVLAQGDASGALDAASLERRLERVEKVLDNQVLVKLLQRIEGLQQEMRELRNQIEQQEYELKSLAERQRDLYLDSDRRLRDLEAKTIVGNDHSAAGAHAEETSADNTASLGVDGSSSISINSAGIDSSNTSSGSGSAVQPASVNSTAQNNKVVYDAAHYQKEKDTYKNAFDYLKEGRYQSSIEAFRKFLADYPNGNYADNAQYWLGEANYVSRNFEEAIREFSLVVSKYSSSPKTPDARLKIGYAHYELENWQAARTTLTALAQDFLNTSVGKLANQRLKKMQSEGH